MTGADIDRGIDTIMSASNPAMVVVTGRSGLGRAGCLVGFHGQVSIEPLRWGVWIARSNHSFAVLTRAELLAIHFLGADQLALAQRFGGLSGDHIDKFVGVDLVDTDVLGPHYPPVIDGPPAVLIGRRASVYDGPTDHACVVVAPSTLTAPQTFEPLRLNDCRHIHPGHPLH